MLRVDSGPSRANQRRSATPDRWRARDDQPDEFQMAHDPLGRDLRHVLVSASGFLPRPVSDAGGVAPRATARSQERLRGRNPKSVREPRPAHMINTQRGAPARRLLASRMAASRSPSPTEALCACTSCLRQAWPTIAQWSRTKLNRHEKPRAWEDERAGQVRAPRRWNRRDARCARHVNRYQMSRKAYMGARAPAPAKPRGLAARVAEKPQPTRPAAIRRLLQ